MRQLHEKRRGDTADGLRAAYKEAIGYAECASGFRDNILLVVMGRGGENCPRTSIHIQGNVVVDYIWEQQEERGRRFRALAAFKHGKRVDIPTEYQRGKHRRSTGE